MPQVSAEERTATLDSAIHDAVKKGARLESRYGDEAVIVGGHRPNHVLHFLLGFPTLGLWWLLVWLPLGVGGGERRRVLRVAPDGGFVQPRPPGHISPVWFPIVVGLLFVAIQWSVVGAFLFFLLALAVNRATEERKLSGT